MKKVCGLAVAAMFVAASALPVMAIEPVEESGGAARPEHVGKVMPQRPNGLGAQQRASGTITEIDQSIGMLTLASPNGPLKLHFPPRSVRDLKKGDKITAHYAFTKGSTPEESVRAYDAPQGLGERRMTGTVEAVDHNNGALQVKTEDTLLVLYFPLDAVRDLKKGERITVDLAYSKES